VRFFRSFLLRILPERPNRNTIGLELESFDESLHDAGRRIAMGPNISFRAGEIAAWIIEAELAHIDEGVET
jgi:hypothetical protein